MSFDNKLPKKTKFLNDNNIPDMSSLVLECLKLWSHKKFLIRKDGIKTIGPVNLYQFVHNYDGSNLVKSIWFDCLMSCDQAVPGSAKYAAAILANQSKPKIIGKIDAFSAYKIAISHIRNQNSITLLKTLFEELSSKASIHLLKTEDINPIIDISDNIILPIKIDPVFERISKGLDIFFQDSHVIVIDGSISSISEINRFLETAATSRESYLIFAKGYHEEVSATLATNFLNKKLAVIPLKLGDELCSINFLGDICAISGATPITSKFGDIIDVSINDIEKRGLLRMFSYSKNKINVRSDLALENYIVNLKRKLELESQIDKQKLLAARISNLTSERVEVRIPKDNKEMFEDCDDFIKTYRNIVESGIIELKNFGAIPINCYINAGKITDDFKENISKISGAIILDN